MNEAETRAELIDPKLKSQRQGGDFELRIAQIAWRIIIRGLFFIVLILVWDIIFLDLQQLRKLKYLAGCGQKTI